MYELDLENENNNDLKNEDLIVWMRIAALPIFRKHAKTRYIKGINDEMRGS